MVELSDILSIEEAAALLGRTPATLRWAAQTGRLPAKRLGRDWVTTYDGVAWYTAFHRRGHKRRLRTLWAASPRAGAVGGLTVSGGRAGPSGP